VRMQNREVSFKILACSALRRAISSLFRELFYRALRNVLIKILKVT